MGATWKQRTRDKRSPHAWRRDHGLNTSQRAHCIGKVSYPNKAQATARAEEIMRTKPIAPMTHVDAYKCKFCGKWHCGNRRVYFRKDTHHADAQLRERSED